ncbi:MAG: GDYXXLXY domain-containing protein [Rhodocyclaceae bacterium]
MQASAGTRAAIIAGLALVLGVVSWSVYENETILADGAVVRLELAPIDPRSLLQGDYMALNYEVNNRLRSSQQREDAYVVLLPDARGVARFVRVQPTPAPRNAGEVAVRYRVRAGAASFGIRGGAVRFATNAFFFEEGTGKRYEKAKYGEFRVSPGGEPRLVALLDAELQRLGDNRY